MIDKKTGHITLAEGVVITENTTLQEFEKEFAILSSFDLNLNEHKINFYVFLFSK
jgi:hypothetical protein